MADVYNLDVGGTTVGANARKTTGTTRIATAPLVFLTVVATQANGSTAVNFSTGFADAGSNFYKAVNAIQGFAEVYMVGTPNGTGFTVAVNSSTVNSGTTNADNTGYGFMEAALVSALAYGGSATATVAEVNMVGVGLA